MQWIAEMARGIGILPYDECSGLAAQLAGKLALLINTREWRSLLAQERLLEEWKELCQQLLDSYFMVDGKLNLFSHY